MFILMERGVEGDDFFSVGVNTSRETGFNEIHRNTLGSSVIDVDFPLTFTSELPELVLGTFCTKKFKNVII